jgi:hypothetical protein
MKQRLFTRRQVQAMVTRTYGLALNDAACARVNGPVEPWQSLIPKVKTLRRDLIAAGTWPRVYDDEHDSRKG